MVDITVQPINLTFPTDTKLLRRTLKTIADQSGPRDPRHSPQDRSSSALEAAFAKLLALARRVQQERRQRGPKVHSLHVPEVECIGKGKAHRSKKYSVKLSVA